EKGGNLLELVLTRAALLKVRRQLPGHFERPLIAVGLFRVGREQQILERGKLDHGLTSTAWRRCRSCLSCASRSRRQRMALMCHWADSDSVLSSPRALATSRYRAAASSGLPSLRRQQAIMYRINKRSSLGGVPASSSRYVPRAA